MVKNAKESRVKQAELASALGAGIIGFGLGVYLANYLQPYALWTIVIGIALHGVAMYKKAEMKPAKLKWAKWLYWLCWAIIIGLVIYIWQALSYLWQAKNSRFKMKSKSRVE